MTLIAGFEGTSRSYLVSDSYITDSADVIYINPDIKRFVSKHYGLVVAGDLSECQDILLFAKDHKDFINKLKTDHDVMAFGKLLVESNEDLTFDSIWRMPNGRVYGIDAQGCSVRAPGQLLVGGNVASYMKGAYAMASKYANHLTVEKRLRMAAEAVLTCAVGAGGPIKIESWKHD